VSQFITVLVGLAALLLFHLSVQRESRRVGRRVGKSIGSLLPGPLRTVLTPYYRRKEIREFQEQRRNRSSAAEKRRHAVKGIAI
jgi:hypothetical protein